MNSTLLYIGSTLMFLLGLVHLINTKLVLSNFHQLPDENTRVLRMQWLGLGLALILIGVMVFFIAKLGNLTATSSRIAIGACGAYTCSLLVLSIINYGKFKKYLPIPITFLASTVCFVLAMLLD